MTSEEIVNVDLTKAESQLLATLAPHLTGKMRRNALRRHLYRRMVCAICWPMQPETHDAVSLARLAVSRPLPDPFVEVYFKYAVKRGIVFG